MNKPVKTTLSLAIICILLAIVLFPYQREIYKDGGTKIYSSLIYQYVKFNTLEWCTKNTLVFCQNKRDYAYYFDKLCKNTEKEGKQTEKLLPKTYSNLSTKSSQDYIRKLLASSTIPEPNIENYFYYVDFFNDAVNNEGLTTGGFQSIAQQPDYLDYDYLTALEKKNFDFMGTNCRISSFTLFKDFIKIWTPTTSGASQVLTFDSSAIENFPEKIFTADETNNFYTFFNQIPTEATKDKTVHIRNIHNYRKEHKISFTNPKWVSLVSVWIHSDLDNAVFIGHIGVLIHNTADNTYIFLEKLSFDTPYLATVFADKSAVYSYLMGKYGKYTSKETAKPFIMENGEVVKSKKE